MDGLSRLMTVFRDEFKNAKVQRCQVHVARNVLSKVSNAKKKEVADRLRDIFYASSRSEAKLKLDTFYESYREVFPSAVKSLETPIEECLTFFSYPKEYWLSLRTSNCIERVNKEFKRRTKPMEVLAGEKSLYRLLCFIAAKMEMGWVRNPVSKATTLLGFSEEESEGKATKKWVRFQGSDAWCDYTLTLPASFMTMERSVLFVDAICEEGLHYSIKGSCKVQ